MTTDEDLIRELQSMGIDAQSHKVVALLPLVQVAWADGKVQQAERSLIVETAEQRGLLMGDGPKILESWLNHPPTEQYLARGQRLLVQLAQRPTGVGETFTLQTLDDVLELCEGVARAYGLDISSLNIHFAFSFSTSRRGPITITTVSSI